MKDYLNVIFIVVGFIFGMIFQQHFQQREKIKAIETSQENTTEIIQTTKQIKDKVQNAKDKNCIDIFNIDITGCVQ